MSAPAVQIATIIDRLTANGEEFARMHWVGPNYSKADLLADLCQVDAELRLVYAERALALAVLSDTRKHMADLEAAKETALDERDRLRAALDAQNSRGGTSLRGQPA
jgi:hypothetical protein